MKIAYLGSIVGPGAKLHGAVLKVKGEERHIDGAGRFIVSRRGPGDSAIISHHRFCHCGLEITICTVGENHSHQAEIQAGPKINILI